MKSHSKTWKLTWPLALVLATASLALARAPELVHLASESHYLCPIHHRVEHLREHCHDDRPTRADAAEKQAHAPWALDTSTAEQSSSECSFVASFHKPFVVSSPLAVALFAWTLERTLLPPARSTAATERVLERAPKRSPPRYAAG